MQSPRYHTVLIADDFEAFRKFLRSELQMVGFREVVEASDGLEAAEKAAELQPTLVLLDIGMPNLDGLRAATRISSIAPKSKVIFVSQNTDPDIIRFALSDGAVGYLCKSSVKRELLPAIQAVLSGKRFACSECARKGVTI